MLVSLKEVSKYVDLKDLTPQEIASKLTSAGIEVEGVKEGLNCTNLVIGEVIECHDHPNSDHLHVCKVDIKDEVLNIVCGAPNVRKNLKVIVAKVGAKLGDIEIKRSEIRGVESEGMLCSLLELGVDSKFLKQEQIDGIEELDQSAEVGNEEVLSFLGLDDTILDLSLLPNRSDCYSILNIAKELGALFNRKVTLPQVKEFKNYEEKEFKASSLTDECPLIYFKIIKGIEVKESPKWLKDCLMSHNIRSIDNIVDLGNYIMLLTGQPIHCYDLDKLPQKELVVRSDIEEDFVALDDKTYKIEKGDLCVTSSSKTMCLGGVLGGYDSEISNTSKNIVVEAAYFNFKSIRHTTQRLGLSSESSLRFTKGINKDQQEYVLNLFFEYLKELSSFKEVSQVIKYDTLSHENLVLTCSKEYINNRLGSSFSLDEIKDCLTRLSFEVEVLDDSKFKVKVPSHRIDVTCNADLSEEVIRFYGFDSIKTQLPVMELTEGGLNETRKKERIIESYLVNQSFFEVLNYTLLSKKDSLSFNYINNNETIEIFNPLSEDRKYLRKNLLTSLLRNMEYNINHQIQDFNLFEISNIYSSLNKEEVHLAILMEGNLHSQEGIFLRNKNYYDAKGIFENILSMFNIDPSRVKYLSLTEEERKRKEFHPFRTSKVMLDGKLLGIIGEIHPENRSSYSLKKEACVLMELNLSRLFETKSKNNRFTEITKFPSVTRDFAFIVSKDISYSQIKQEIKKVSSLIKEVILFDIFKKDDEDLKVSYAFRIVLQKDETTLTNDEITNVDQKVRDTLISKFNVVFRS